MAKKPKRTTPRIPKGFRDLPGPQVVARRTMIQTVVEVYERFGFQALETPAIEYLDVLGKYLPEQDEPEGGVFSFRYDDQEWVALRYDLTAPLSRFVAKNFQELGVPFRRYQAGQVWRLEKPEPGRFREFTQLDIDIVGASGPIADAEILHVLVEALRALGLDDADFHVKVNHRQVLNGLLDACGVTDAQAPTVLRALDKLDRLGIDGVRALLGDGRKDEESGVFTAGAGLPADAQERILQFVQAPESSRAGYLETVQGLVGETKAGAKGIEDMRTLDAILTERDLPTERVTFAASIVRGLAYYTGPVYEVQLTRARPDGRAYGSVAGGGRYDELIKRFTGQQVAATGASIGVDRLLAALVESGQLDLQPSCQVLITAIDKGGRAEYHAMAQELRAAGIPTELYVGGGNVAKQFKYADRREYTVAVVAGGDEFAKGEVSIKDLRHGRELSQSEDFEHDRKAWLEALPGQVSVPRAQLVETVREILGRYRTP